MRLLRVRIGIEYLRSSFWFLPAVAVTLAVIGGSALARVQVAEEGLFKTLIFGGGGDGARGVLETIAGSMITVTALTFSLTVVTLQLSSSQFSPRLLRTFMRDIRNQAVLAILLATFVFSLTVLRTVRTADDTGSAFVPSVAVTVAYLLAVASVAALVWFIQHIVTVIRIGALMPEVRRMSHKLIDEVYPRDHASAVPVDSTVPDSSLGTVEISAVRSGFLVALDEKALRRLATEYDALIRVDVSPGDWLLPGVCWARLERTRAGLGGEPEAELAARMDKVLSTSSERTGDSDVRYGLVQLVDIAAKALSPGVNDPTTAVHSLRHLSSLMVDLVHRPGGPRLLHDDDDRLRVVLARPFFADLLEVACGQVRRYGAGDPWVMAALLDLIVGVGVQVASGSRRDAVIREFEELARAARAGVAPGLDTTTLETRLARAAELLGLAVPEGAPPMAT